MADATLLYNGAIGDTATWLAVLPSTVDLTDCEFVVSANGLHLMIVLQGV